MVKNYVFFVILLKNICSYQSSDYHNDVVIEFEENAIKGPVEDFIKIFEKKHQLEYHGTILQKYFHFKNKKIRKRSIFPHDYETKFSSDTNIKW